MRSNSVASNARSDGWMNGSRFADPVQVEDHQLAAVPRQGRVQGVDDGLGLTVASTSD